MLIIIKSSIHQLLKVLHYCVTLYSRPDCDYVISCSKCEEGYVCCFAAFFIF